LNKLWLVLLIGVSPSLSFAWGRLGHGANIVTQNSGDTGNGISVSVSSTSATKVYTGAAKHREILLQNTNSTYVVYCGTHSAVTASSGPRWALWTKPSGNYTSNGTFSIWCIGESGAPSIEILGSVEYDAKD